MVHITYPILCMSYSYTYITFMVIYYTSCYVLFSCTVIMYYFHILYSCTVSCTVFIYCFPVILFILLSLSCTVLVHILFVYCTLYFPYTVFILNFHIILHSYTFLYIMSDRIISCYRTYHHIAVLCFSDHIISFHMSYANHLFYVSCLHKPSKWIKETIRARKLCYHCTRQ